MSLSIGEENSQALLAGCDQTSFAHYGKKTAWEALGAMNDVKAAFQALSNALMVNVVDKVMPIGLITVFGAILTGIQSGQKLQCLSEWESDGWVSD